MTGIPSRSSWPKRILLTVAALIAFLLLFVIALRITVSEMYRGGGIESSRVTGLSAVSPSWDERSMWATAPMLQRSVDFARVNSPWESPVARTADLRTRSDSFDRSVSELHRIVSAHQAYLEDLRTETRSGSGRALAATLSVPSKEFDAAISDLKALGRTEAVSEAGEDSAVKLATTERHLATAQTNLSRLQKLQRERKGELRDAVALEKDIAQASEIAAEAQREHERLVSTVAQAHIHLLLMEDFRAPFEANLAGSSLALRNSFVEGVSAIFFSVALVLGVLFEFGLPLLFWAALLFLPVRLAWRRYRPSHPHNPSVPADHATA
jgi:Domain of unknown function (DUF4349)